MSQHIVKYAAAIIRDRKILFVRDKGEDFFKNVGGKIENNETSEECLKREINEELGVDLINTPQYYFSLPVTKAANNPDVTIEIHLYKCEIEGNPKPSAEIEELHWLSKQEFEQDKIKLTYQIKDFIVPRLIADELI